MKDAKSLYQRRWHSAALALCGILLAGGVNGSSAARAAIQTASGTTNSAQGQNTLPTGAPFSQDQLSTMLPSTVYFAGRTAPLQMRNAAGMRFAGGTIFWAALVDSSGYATSVQEKFQFYLVTEGPIRIGSLDLRAGAYGAGFVGDRLVVMDLGNHTVGESPTQMDAAMRRPRPLQLVVNQPNNAKLFLGRRWVSVQPAAH